MVECFWKYSPSRRIWVWKLLRQRQSWGHSQGKLGLGLPLALGAEYKYSNTLYSQWGVVKSREETM